MVKNILIKYWPWLILAVLYWAMAFVIINHEYNDYGGDSAQYIMVAESALAGKGYVMSNYPGEPVSFLYPPVFPTLLMPVLYFFGRNFYAMYLLIAALGFCTLLLGYKLFKLSVSPVTAYLAILCTAVNWHYNAYAFSFIRSEIPYTFFSFVALWATGVYRRQPSTANGIYLGLALLSAYFTRYAAVTLIAAVFLVLIVPVDGKRRVLLPAIIFFVPFCLWNLWKFSYKTYTISQVEFFFAQGDFVARLVKSVNYYADHIVLMIYSALLGSSPWWIYILLFLVTIAFLVYGFYKSFYVFSMRTVGGYVFIYFMLIGFWPARDGEGARFLVPMIPFIFLYIFYGIKKIVMPEFVKKFFSIFVVVCCLVSLPGSIIDYLSPQSSSIPFGGYKEASLWLKNQGHDGDVIMARKPTVASFYSGKKAVIFPHTLNAQEIWDVIDSNRVKYIIVDTITKDAKAYLVPGVMQRAERIKPVYVVPGAFVFEVLSCLIEEE